ncbi:SipW-dependent-type signal peptide-containing protein [Arthrobacter sp. TMN-49]
MAKHAARLRRRRFTRGRAVLAGALVLGLGATMTVAAWTNSENVTGSFAASTFTTESSTISGVWASNTTSPGAGLAFNAVAMSPSVSLYAWANVRTTAASTVGGTITLASVSTSGPLVPVLEYRAVRTPAVGTGCDGNAFTGTPTFIAGSVSTYLAVTTVPASPVTSAITAPSGEIRYCFEVRVQPGAANSYQGQTGAVHWLFSGIST